MLWLLPPPAKPTHCLCLALPPAVGEQKGREKKVNLQHQSRDPAAMCLFNPFLPSPVAKTALHIAQPELAACLTSHQTSTFLWQDEDKRAGSHTQGRACISCEVPAASRDAPRQ